MKILLNTVLIISWCFSTGCSNHNPRQTAFEKVKKEGNYQLIASTTIEGDTVEFWKESKGSDNSPFGRILMTAVTQPGKFLDYCEGEVVSSGTPFFQSRRYVAIVAAIALDKEREVFFVYDSKLKKFLSYSVEKFVPHVHDNILIMGDVAFFTSCKTPTPLGRLDLKTGKINIFGTPAPQSATFYLAGSDILVEGTDRKIYKVGEKELIQVDSRISKNQIAQMSFDSILKSKITLPNQHLQHQ